jgi:hypothetical protein
LSKENAHLLLASFGEGYPHFSLSAPVENNRFNTFFLTVPTGIRPLPKTNPGKNRETRPGFMKA